MGGTDRQRRQELRGTQAADPRQAGRKLDLTRVSDLAGDALRREIRRVVEHLCDTENPLLNRMERERLIDEVLDETFGFGPLEVLLKDPTISDILVNGPHKIYVERRGKLEKTDVKFRDNDHLLQIIDRIVSKVGRRVDETSPDGGRPPARRLPRQRHHPAAGPGRRRRVSIRRFGANPLKLEDLLNYKAFTPEMAMLMEACIKARLNIIISRRHRLRQDDAAEHAVELHPARRAHRHHRGRGRTAAAAGPRRPAGNAAAEHRRQGRGRRPATWCATPCVCGPNASSSASAAAPRSLDMLQAMNTGHDGSMTTLHANTPRDAQARLETMIMMAGFELPIKAMRQQIASAVDLIIQANRLQGGPRKVTQHHRGDGHGAGHHHHAGDLPLQAAGHRPERPGLRPVRGDRRAADVRQPPGADGHQAAVEHVPGARAAARLRSTCPSMPQIASSGSLDERHDADSDDRKHDRYHA